MALLTPCAHEVWKGTRASPESGPVRTANARRGDCRVGRSANGGKRTDRYQVSLPALPTFRWRRGSESRRGSVRRVPDVVIRPDFIKDFALQVRTRSPVGKRPQMSGRRARPRAPVEAESPCRNRDGGQPVRIARKRLHDFEQVRSRVCLCDLPADRRLHTPNPELNAPVVRKALRSRDAPPDTRPIRPELRDAQGKLANMRAALPAKG